MDDQLDQPRVVNVCTRVPDSGLAISLARVAVGA